MDKKVGFGTYRLRENTEESVKNAILNGYRIIDTAPLYKNEKQVGLAIKNCGIDRTKIKITTKISRNELKKNKISESIENSLQTMNLNYIDELILHEPIDPLKNWELLYNYYKTKGKGKVLSIGVSNFGIDDLQLIKESKLELPCINQIELNPFLARNKLTNFCNQYNINIVAHSPLAKGEKLNDTLLNSISNNYNVSPAQIMLKWGLINNYRVIPRSKQLNHIQENLLLNFNINNNDILTLNKMDCKYTTHPKYIKKYEY
jgi:diketogulonate reductase-like aldo/keto reductase